jgi:hypothetical protein
MKLDEAEASSSNRAWEGFEGWNKTVYGRCGKGSGFRHVSAMESIPLPLQLAFFLSSTVGAVRSGHVFNA